MVFTGRVTACCWHSLFVIISTRSGKIKLQGSTGIIEINIFTLERPFPRVNANISCLICIVAWSWYYFIWIFLQRFDMALIVARLFEIFTACTKTERLLLTLVVCTRSLKLKINIRELSVCIRGWCLY